MPLQFEETTYTSSQLMKGALPRGGGSTICGFARRVMLQTHTAWKIIGFSIYDNNDKPLDTLFSLIPSSTDMALDVCCLLASLHYDFTPKVRSEVEAGANSVATKVHQRDGIRLVEVSVFKQFTSDKPYMTTDDFGDVLQFYGISQPVVLLHVTNPDVTLKFHLFLQEVTGNQSDKTSQLKVNHVLDSTERTDLFFDDGNNSQVKQIMPASTTEDFRIKCDVVEHPAESFSITLCTIKGDPKKQELITRFENILRVLCSLYDNGKIIATGLR